MGTIQSGKTNCMVEFCNKYPIQYFGVELCRFGFIESINSRYTYACKFDIHSIIYVRCGQLGTLE